MDMNYTKLLLVLFTLYFCGAEGQCPVLPPTPPYAEDALCPVIGSWLSYYNLITLGDLSTSSDVEGKTFVGGNLVSSASANFATKATGSAATVPSLEITGTVIAGSAIQVNNGGGLVGTGTVTHNPSDVIPYYVDGRRFNMNNANSGATMESSTLLRTKARIIKYDLQSWSNKLIKLQSNNLYTKPSSQPGPFVLTVKTLDANRTAIFRIAENDLFGNNLIQQIEVQDSLGASAIIVNVAGSYVTWTAGNMVGTFLTGLDGRSKIIWNFYEAATINLQSFNFMGALLAPYAAVTAGGRFDGAMAVKSLTTTASVNLPLPRIGCKDASTTSLSSFVGISVNSVAPPAPPVSAPTNRPSPRPTPRPTAAPSKGCCSQDYKTCTTACGTTQTQCQTCKYYWLANGPITYSCLARGSGCYFSPGSCCPGLTCKASPTLSWYKVCEV